MDHLKANGIDVYSPGIKTGECKAPYVVVKDAGASKMTSFSSMNHYYDILIYVPARNYSKLEPYVNEIKKLMTELKPTFREAGQETEAFYDDTNKSHMISVMYKNYRKL